MLKPLAAEFTLLEELNKLGEEVDEFLIAISNDDKENLIEEFYDVIQVMRNILDIKGISQKDIETSLNIHKYKLLNRGYKFKEE